MLEEGLVVVEVLVPGKADRSSGSGCPPYSPAAERLRATAVYAEGDRSEAE